MPASGEHKKELNFLSHRVEKQMKQWPRLVRGEVEGIDLSKIDKEILECCLEGKYFRGEGHFSEPDGAGRERTPMEELWLLYIGVQELTEEEEKRGKKKSKKDKLVQPIKARRVAFVKVLDKKGKPTGEFIYEVNFHDDGYLDFPAWLYARDQARKDLLFLNRNVLGNDLLIPRVHQVVCDQFVVPNFDGVYDRGYGIQELVSAIRTQNRVPVKFNPETKNYVPRSQWDSESPDNYSRTSLTEDARDFFKSTIGRAHTTQLMLAIPDVSMIILCADNRLAEIFVSQIKLQFFLGEGADHSPLHLLFPEYILRGVKGTSNEPLECPARRLDRTYPTLWADSIESTLSGLHCDFLKFDDVVSNTNCQTPITREKLKNHIDTTMSVCDAWGWVDMIGTRYYPDDYYGYLEFSAKDNPEAYGIKLFKRAAWYVKSEFSHIGNKKVKELKEHMVDLTFPEHADWRFLQGKLKNEYTFRCQYLNEPVYGDDGIDMPIELLKAHLMNADEAKLLKGDIYIVGDMAKEAKTNSDYSMFAAMKIYRKRNPDTGVQDGTVAVVVLDIVYGKWTQTQIAQEMADLNRKWLLKKIHVEDTGGLESFWLFAVRDAFQRTALPMYHIYRAPVQQGFDAKRNRVKGLEVLLKSDRLYFAMGTWNDEAFSQISQYKGQKSTRTRKDDIPDGLSFISEYLPSATPKTPEQQQQDLAQKEFMDGQRILHAQHEAMFGRDYNFRQRPDIAEQPISEPERRPIARTLVRREWFKRLT